MPLKVRQMLEILEADGWCVVRMKGSHRQLRHPTKLGAVTVVGKLSADIPIGTERRRQAGV